MKLTISKEDYLKAIAEAESEEEPVIAATIALVENNPARRGPGLEASATG